MKAKPKGACLHCGRVLPLTGTRDNVLPHRIRVTAWCLGGYDAKRVRSRDEMKAMASLLNEEAFVQRMRAEQAPAPTDDATSAPEGSTPA